jgi:NADH:ubiquinone oxidoreductase subunit
MVGWGIDSFLSGKFMEIWRMEGLIRTLQRGRAVRYRNIHDNAGSRRVVPCVGEDVHGNRYYEDVHGDDSNESKTSYRWVEYNDRFEWFMTGRKVPPEWHGWLVRQYDDAPVPGNTTFYNPVFKRRHQPLAAGTPKGYASLGHHSAIEHKKTFHNYVKSRVYAPWNPEEATQIKAKKRYD